MALKNRPTLKQQFSDFINRISPFDGNALIQKTEHNQVEDDLFDSLLNSTDSSDLINSPSAAINLDFSAFDMYRINSSGSGETTFNITINNLGTGQVARIHITKKSNDTYSFTNAVIGQINNLKQTGTILSFFVHNVNGVLVAYSDMTVAKSNSITDSDPEKLATAKAVNDLNTALTAVDDGLEASKIAIDGSIAMTGIFDFGFLRARSLASAVGDNDAVNKLQLDLRAVKSQEAWTNITLINGWTARGGNTPQFRTDEFGMVHVRGVLEASSAISSIITGSGAVPVPPSGSNQFGAAWVLANAASAASSKVHRVSIDEDGAMSMAASDFDASADAVLTGMGYWTDDY